MLACASACCECVCVYFDLASRLSRFFLPFSMLHRIDDATGCWWCSLGIVQCSHHSIHCALVILVVLNFFVSIFAIFPSFPYVAVFFALNFPCFVDDARESKGR